jgi:hypothetical protein
MRMPEETQDFTFVVDPTREKLKCPDCRACEAVVRREHAGLDTRWAPIESSPTPTLHAFDSQSGDPYHHRFKREVSWLRTWDISDAPPLVYVAHPVSGDFRANVAEARNWVKWLRRLTLDDIHFRLGFVDLLEVPTFNAPWLVMPEDIDLDKRARARLIRGCAATASRHDEVWVFVRWSGGVSDEARAARRVRNLTHLGKTPPEWGRRR